MHARVPLIGRLHRVESEKQIDGFEQMKPGDRIEAKILKMSELKGKSLIELTQRKEHMREEKSGLNQELLKLLSLDTLANGQEVDALVTDVVPANIINKVSCPVQVAVSPYVRSSLLFSDIISPHALLNESFINFSDYICKKYSKGKRVKLIYQDGKFRLGERRNAFQKGDLAVVRFVKANAGFGITVQLD